MKKLTFLFVIILLFASCKKEVDPVESKIQELISQMTLAEKIGQLNQTDGGDLNELRQKVARGEVGAIFNFDVRYIDEIQQIAVEQSRMGIPIIFARDVIHGYHTIFPIPLAQGATWNKELVEQGCRIAAIEATAEGIRWTFSPMVDVTRDPRWGRVAEGYGEDPYLTSVMGAAAVRGYQTQSPENEPTAMAACVKHFAGYGATESGRDYNVTFIPQTQFRNIFLPPFKACIDAGALSLMASFNEVNGVPNHANRHNNVDILRTEWGYDGVLDGDWGAVNMLINHGIATDQSHAAKLALDAGLDMDMADQLYHYFLPSLVEDGIVTEEQINQAVARVLRLKFRIGLFDNPYIDKHEYEQEEHLNIAQKAAEESVVLLKNEAVLPLQKDKIKRVAVVGPLADAPIEQCGTWCFDADYSLVVTPLQAIRERVEVIYEPILTHARDLNEPIIPKSLNGADVILCFLGEEALMSGEGKCMADLNLKGAQSQMVERLAGLNKPLVLVFMAGRPLTIENEVKHADVVLYALHGGAMAGEALANIIFGDVNPSGKLPITMPRATGQIPIYYSKYNTGRPADHDPRPLYEVPVGAAQFSFGDLSFFLDAGSKPLYPFGYGMSYTKYEYGEVKCVVKGDVEASCVVKNVGQVGGYEVVECYVRDVVGDCGQTRPLKQLVGFEKVYLKAGEEKKVVFHIDKEQLGYWHSEQEGYTERVYFATDKGDYLLWIAPSSDAGEPVSFKIE